MHYYVGLLWPQLNLCGAYDLICQDERQPRAELKGGKGVQLSCGKHFCTNKAKKDFFGVIYESLNPLCYL